ncbi:MAG: sugar ABC transporter permease [Acidobacteriota bacterium]|nr:sugar ABC transporter permease [Acidobacteriota bacterium]
MGAPTPEAAPKIRFLEREAPLGYALVLPAALYLALFIAYPFLMSIFLSLSDAQAGNKKWSYIGTDNYSKVQSYDLLANDFVIATFPSQADARAFIAQKPSGKVETAPAAGSLHVAKLAVAGRSIPILEMEKEDDASFAASTVLQDTKWEVRPGSGGKWEAVAHAKGSPISLGSYTKKSELEKARKELLVPVRTEVQIHGTGVLQDPNFRLALRNTFKYTFGTEILKLLIGVPCALLLNRRFGGRRLIRGLVVIPWVIPIAISAQAWLWILDSTYSVINWCLVHWGGLSPSHIINFRGDKDLAMLSVIVVNVWRGFPFTTIIILAGLTAIPDEILERARLEGASAFQRFVHIISPMLRPILMVSLLFSVIFSFTDFNTIWIITKGGPFDQTQVLATYAYQLGVNAGYLGKGAAISLFMFPIMAVMVFFMLQFLRREA